MMLKGMTARYLLPGCYKVKSGDSVLIHAAAGGEIPEPIALLLQQLTHALLTSNDARGHLESAASTYAERRLRVIDALRSLGYDARGASGFNIWVPVREETAVVQALAKAGWAIRAGEGFRLASSPGVRITTATVTGDEVDAIAAVFAELPQGLAQVAR